LAKQEWKFHRRYLHNQMSPVHMLPFALFKIRFNIILPSVPRSSKWSILFRFSLHAFRLC